MFGDPNRWRKSVICSAILPLFLHYVTKAILPSKFLARPLGARQEGEMSDMHCVIDRMGFSDLRRNRP